jgi:uncharacterized Zn ribbon protein
MKRVALLFLVLFSTYCYSQKISLKKGDILVDEVAWMKYTECGTFDSTCSILNMNGDEIIFIKQIKIPGAEPMTKSNPEGTLHFKEVKFLGLDALVEFEHTTDKKILALIYNAKLINEKGEVDEEKVQRFVEKHGTPVSDRRGNTNTNTIIIQESPAPRRGVNINIGR